MYPVATMCRLLGISTSGCYAWHGRAPSAHAESDASLLERIREIHHASRGTYGAPRIHAEQADQGHTVSRKRIARLMRNAGLAGISRRKETRTTVRGAIRGNSNPLNASSLLRLTCHAWIWSRATCDVWWAWWLAGRRS